MELGPPSLNSETHWTVANTQPRLVYCFLDIEIKDVHIIPTGRVDEEGQPTYIVEKIKNHPVSSMVLNRLESFYENYALALVVELATAKKITV
jgi:hypothetical protein